MRFTKPTPEPGWSKPRLWFAWRPVRLKSGEVAWLEWVWWKRFQPDVGSNGPAMEYHAWEVFE